MRSQPNVQSGCNFTKGALFGSHSCKSVLKELSQSVESASGAGSGVRVDHAVQFFQALLDGLATRIQSDVSLTVERRTDLQDTSQIFHRFIVVVHRTMVALCNDACHVLLGRGAQPDGVAVSEQQLEEIDRVLRQTPRAHGLGENLWDGKTLSAFIEKRYRAQLGTRQCQRLFRQLGFRLRKPRPALAHADPLLQKRYKKNSKP